MRILFVSNFYPPNSLGGVQLYTHGIATALQARGHTLRVLAAGTWDVGGRHDNGVVDSIVDGINVRRLQLNWRKASAPFRSLYANPAAAATMHHTLQEFQPDVVHITSLSHLSVAVLFAAKRAGVPVVLTLPDFWPICPRYTLTHATGTHCTGDVSPVDCINCLAWNAKIRRWPRRFLPPPWVDVWLMWLGKQAWLSNRRGLIGLVGDIEERRAVMRQALTDADVVLTLSQFVKDAYNVQRMPADRIQVLPWGISSEWKRPPQTLVAGCPLRFRFLGRLAPIKGAHLLLEAFRPVTGRVELHLHGTAMDETYAERLHELAHADSRIIQHGSYTKEQLGDILACSDVVIVPSIVPETYCLVAREALLAGVPVIASRIGALPDAVKDGENGILVAPGDVAALTQAMQRLYDDPAERTRLANATTSIPTVDDELDELLRIYTDLVDRYRAIQP